MTERHARVAIAALALGLAGAAFAASPVQGRIEAYLVATDAEGAERVEPTRTAEPGVLMEYRLTFVNTGDSAVSGLQVVDPIPDNTTFVAGSARADVDARFEVSIDGARSFEREPVTRVETRPDGTQEKVVIPPSQYTHLRWAVEEALPGGGGEHRYAYRVTVD